MSTNPGKEEGELGGEEEGWEGQRQCCSRVRGGSSPPGPWQLWKVDKESREADIKPSLRVIVDLLREGGLGSLER